MILGMVLGDIDLGTATVIIPFMLLVAAAIIMEVRPSVLVPSAKTVLLMAAITEVHQI